MGSSDNGVGQHWFEYSDEELAWLAQHGDLRPAWEEVRRRTLPWVAPLVAHLVHGLPLRDGDLPDAQQVAALAIREALLRFDLGQLDGPNPCHFTTFLNQMIRSRVSNFARGTQRAERRYDHSLDAADAAGTAGDAHKSKDEDPAQLAAGREDQARLEAALAELPELARQVLEGVRQGKTVQEIAQELGQPYKRIWNLKEKVMKQLRSQLGDVAGDDPG